MRPSSLLLQSRLHLIRRKLWKKRSRYLKKHLPTERRRYKKLLSDPIYDPLYSYLEECDVSVTLHSGDPDYFWITESMKELFDDIKISKDETFEDVSPS